MFIYESGWDKLNDSKNDSSFKQCVSSQFKTKTLETTSNNNQGLSKQDKQVQVLEISFSIPFRPSKSVLAKSKFFNKN